MNSLAVNFRPFQIEESLLPKIWFLQDFLHVHGKLLGPAMDLKVIGRFRYRLQLSNQPRERD